MTFDELMKQAKAHFEASEFAKELDCLWKATVLDPGNAVPYYHLGAAYYRLNDFHNAMMAFSVVIVLDPKNYYNYICRGNVFFITLDIFNRK